MNIVFIVPTGIGAEIGGHSGDATPAAKLIASVCDKLIIHPNVVNASDINEMTENMLYVEGSILDKFLEGKTGLEEVYNNKILVAVNKVTPDIVNAVSGARVTIGADIEIIELKKPIKMIASIVDNKATGDLYNVDEAIDQLMHYDFDVLVVNTPVETQDEDVIDYLSKDGGVNLWGGIEAKLSKLMSEKLNKPVIHSPTDDSATFSNFDKVVDPRKAAEMVSKCYLHCCLKGGHTAPEMSLSSNAYWNTDIDFLISPIGVYGKPHIACIKNDIQIIAVEENKTVLNSAMPDNVIFVKNYLEAVGVICARKAGIMLSSIHRPIERTTVHEIYR